MVAETPELGTLVTQLAYRLGAASGTALRVGLPVLHETLHGLAQALGDGKSLRPGDGQALIGALDAMRLECSPDWYLEHEAQAPELQLRLDAVRAAACELGEAIEDLARMQALQ